jgi:hypothetical protein
VTPLLPKVYSTAPAGVLVLSATTWTPLGWRFSACANAQVKETWDGWASLQGAYKHSPMVWYDHPDDAAPPCPGGQIKRSYLVVLDGQPAPGDYTVKLGPQPPGVVAVPLVLRVPGAAYQQKLIQPPTRPPRQPAGH